MGRGAPGVTLQILDAHVGVDSEDVRVVELVRLLWQPLVVDGSGPPSINVRTASAEGRVRVTTEPAGSSFDDWEGQSGELWPLMLTIRYILGEIAVEQLAQDVVLHAAVAADDEGAVLLIGPNGTGKTTLVLEMLRQGWTYLSDDLAPLGTDGKVIPFPKPLGIRGDPGRWSELLSLWTPPSWLPEPTGAFLIPPTAFETARGPIEPRAIVFPTYDESGPPEGVLEALTTARALADIGEQASNFDAVSMRRVSTWLRGVPSYRVRYSSAERLTQGGGLRTL